MGQASSNQPQQDVSLAMLDLLQAMTRFLIAEGRKLDPTLKITPPQFRVLTSLERSPNMSLNEIAAELGVRAPTASVLVLRLVKQGLVERQSSEGRRLSLALSSRGGATLKGSREVIINEISARLSAWSAADLAAAEKILRELQQVL